MLTSTDKFVQVRAKIMPLVVRQRLDNKWTRGQRNSTDILAAQLSCQQKLRNVKNGSSCIVNGLTSERRTKFWYKYVDQVATAASFRAVLMCGGSGVGKVFEMHLPLLQFILHYFMEWNLNGLAILHCWSAETQKIFLEMATNRYIYTQYLNLNNGTDIARIEYGILQHERPELGVFMDMDCDQTVLVLEKISRLRFYSHRYRFLIYDRTANVPNFHGVLENFNLTVSTDLTYAVLDNQWHNGSSYRLYDVYNNGRIQGGKLNMTLDREIVCGAMSCQLSKYLSKLHLRTKYGHRNQLRDLTLRMAVVITKRPTDGPLPELIEFLLSVDDKGVDTIARLSFQGVWTLKDHLYCNLTVVMRDSWGVTETTGGTIGEITGETADIVSSPFLLTLSRLRHCSPLTETSTFRSICLFRTPRNTGIQGDVFLKPFSFTVWLLFGVVLVIVAIFLWSTFIVENRRKRYLGYVPSLLSTCLISFGSACIQGSNIIPLSLGGRVAFLWLYVISFIMYNYYTSIVVSTLLGSPVKSDIKTLGDLADSSLEVGLEPLPFTFVYLNASQLPDVRRFVKRKIDAKPNPQRVWMPVENGVLRVRDDPGFVFVFEATTGYPLIEKFYKPHEICDLNEVMLRHDKSLYTQVHQNSSFKELFRLKELRLKETGIYLRLRRYWVQLSLNCYSNNFMVEVGLEYTAPLFFMLLCAYLLVLLVLLFEIGYKKYVDKKKDQFSMQ